jgi:hypothetical protein
VVAFWWRSLVVGDDRGWPRQPSDLLIALQRSVLVGASRTLKVSVPQAGLPQIVSSGERHGRTTPVVPRASWGLDGRILSQFCGLGDQICDQDAMPSGGTG